MKNSIAKEKNVNDQFVEAVLTYNNQVLIVESDTESSDGPVEAVVVSPQFIFELANKLQMQGDSEYWDNQAQLEG